MATFAIILEKNNKEIGSLLRHFQDCQLDRILRHVGGLIYNYNKNLASLVESIPDEILAHRFFEGENLEGNLYNAWSLIFSESDTKARDVAGKIFLPVPSKQHRERGVIGLVDDDIFFIKKSTMHKVYINLDKRVIELCGLVRFQSREEYCKTRNITIEEFSKIEFERSLLDPSQFTFNEFEDMEKLFKDNPNGWIFKVSNIICSARELENEG